MSAVKQLTTSDFTPGSTSTNTSTYNPSNISATVIAPIDTTDPTGPDPSSFNVPMADITGQPVSAMSFLASSDYSSQIGTAANGNTRLKPVSASSSTSATTDPSTSQVASSSSMHVLAASTTKTAPIAATTSQTLVANPEPAAAAASQTPSYQSPPGGSIVPPGYYPNTAASAWAGTGYIQSNWLGGDPNTGVNGDTGAYGGIGNSVSFNQSQSALSGVTESAWGPGAVAQVNSGNVTGGLQTAINNISWDVNNLEGPSTITTASAQFQAVDQSWVPSAACVGALVTVIGTVVGSLVAPETLGVNITPLIGGLITAAAACSNYIPANPPNPETDPQMFAQYGGTMMMIDGFNQGLSEMSRVHGDFTPVTDDGVRTDVSNAAITPTPGFTPPASVLNALKGDMTAKALATYFPHG